MSNQNKPDLLIKILAPWRIEYHSDKLHLVNLKGQSSTLRVYPMDSFKWCTDFDKLPKTVTKFLDTYYNELHNVQSLIRTFSRLDVLTTEQIEQQFSHMTRESLLDANIRYIQYHI